MSAAPVLKRAVRAVVGSEPYLRVSRLTDRFVLRTELRKAVGPADYSALVLATAGHGNIGDQAMLNAVLASVPGRIAVVLTASTALKIPVEHRQRVHIEVLPSLVMGAPFRRVSARRAFIGLLRRSQRLLVIGADIMDGSYDRREAVLRFHLARLAREVGVPTRVLGFSWSARADRIATAEAVATAPFIELMAREPQSAARMRASGITPVYEVADVVFSLETDVQAPTDIGEWIANAHARGAIVILNTSGLLASRHPGIRSSYVSIARGLLERGHSVLLLPHVLRAGDDDLSEARLLVEELGAREDLLLVDRELAPEEVGAVARLADAVVTGRMHLAILAMNTGTPAAIISSQGKVRGLLELAGLGRLELSPDDDLTAAALEAVDLILSDQSLRTQLETSLESIRALSRDNFLP